ncbi:MAG: ABC transporter ATP-binding protein [Rubrivivax sp.]|nr:ABC transporter ATP-binding protein [Rubrivivax sp.]
MLQLEAVRAGYGPLAVLHGVDLQVRPGEVLALLGRNGAGRSTTAKAIVGQVPAQGSIRWCGRELLGLAGHRIARLGVGYVPESRDVFPGLTVRQNLMLGEQRGRGQGPWTVPALMRLFPALEERLDTLAGVLSGGEQQMLALARTLRGDPALLVVDEPCEGLAPALVRNVATVLGQLRQRGAAVLLIEQKLSLALDLADRCAVMGRGRIVFEGLAAELEAAVELQREWLEA